MSLINDALKRAKAAQQKEPPAAASPLQFKPVDSSQKPRRRLPWPIILGLGFALVAGLLLIKLFAPKEAPLKVEAKSVTAAPMPTNEAAPLAVLSTAILPPVPKPTTLQPRTQEVATAIAAAPTDALKASAPRLQALFYSRTRPSAMINGKNVFVGDKVGEFRVAEITRDSATLISATQTNILTFEQ